MTLLGAAAGISLGVLAIGAATTVVLGLIIVGIALVVGAGAKRREVHRA